MFLLGMQNVKNATLFLLWQQQQTQKPKKLHIFFYFFEPIRELNPSSPKCKEIKYRTQHFVTRGRHCWKTVRRIWSELLTFWQKSSVGWAKYGISGHWRYRIPHILVSPSPWTSQNKGKKRRRKLGDSKECNPCGTALKRRTPDTMGRE